MDCRGSPEVLSVSADQRGKDPKQEVVIRNVAVGLIAVATLAAASLIIRNRKGVESLPEDSPRTDVEDLYAAGL